MKSFEQQPVSSSTTNPFRSVEQSRSQSRSRFGLNEQWLLKEIEQLQPTDYEPILAGKGGEHLVFELPVRPNADPKKRAPERVRNVVVKINVTQTLDHFSFEDLKDAQRTERGLERMEDAMAEREERLEELREHFGRDAVPAQRFFIADVPVSREIFRKLRPDWLPEKTSLPFRTIPAWVEVQRRVDLDPDTTISLNGTYLESDYSPLATLERHESEKLYALAHEVLTGMSDLSPERQRAIALRVYPNLKNVDARMREPAFGEALQNFVEKLISYSEKTHDAMDLMGKNNLVLTKTADGWKPKLLDVLHVDDFSFDDFDVAVRAAKSAKRISSEIAGGVYNAMNTVRVINALAILANVPDRLRVDALDEASAAGWKEIITERGLSLKKAA